MRGGISQNDFPLKKLFIVSQLLFNIGELGIKFILFGPVGIVQARPAPLGKHGGRAWQGSCSAAVCLAWKTPLFQHGLVHGRWVKPLQILPRLPVLRAVEVKAEGHLLTLHGHRRPCEAPFRTGTHSPWPWRKYHRRWSHGRRHTPQSCGSGSSHRPAHGAA